MESFLKLYFGNALGRSRVMLTLIYVITMIVVVTEVLVLFNIHYAYPKEITLVTCFSFVLSGQILYPLAGVIVYYGLNDAFVYFIANPLYNKYKFYIFRDRKDEDCVVTIERELMDKRFISWNLLPNFKTGPPLRGNQFHQFEEFLKGMFWEEFNVASSWKLTANASFAVMLAMGFHLKDGSLVVIAFILACIAWVLFSLVFWQFQRQAEYREIYEQFYFIFRDNEFQNKEIFPISTWNKHSKRFQQWEWIRRAKNDLKNGSKSGGRNYNDLHIGVLN